MIRRIREGRSIRGAAVLTLVLLGLLLIAGLAADRDAFLNNLLAELVGVGVGVLVALFLVDRLTAARRRDRWLRVREQTLSAVFAHITDLTRKCLLYTPIGDQVEAQWVDSWFDVSGNHPSAAAEHVLRSIAEVVGERAHEMSSLDGYGVANSRVALEAVTPHVTYIRDMLISRLIEFDEVPELVERLLVMTDVERDWSLQVAFSEKGDLQEIWVGWDRAGRFFEACADVVADLVALDPSAAERGGTDARSAYQPEADRYS